MLLEAAVYRELFGSIMLHEVQRVLKLDTETKFVKSHLIQNIDRDKIYETLGQLAIVVPMKDEKLQLIDGVLKAIPHKCPIIIVSGSQKEGTNRYKLEVELVKHFYHLTQSRVIMVHQRDAALAEEFRKAGYDAILDEQGLVRRGKGEGMIVGMLIAKAIGARYVGFVDADNYIPGAVNEYVKDYAAGILMSSSDYVMVRLSWRHKPKVSGQSLYFRKWGRVSEITNRYMNLLIGARTGFETNIIVTGNAGEHAMSLKLADVMEFSTGYSIEPYQLVYLIENFGGESAAEKMKHVYDAGIEIFQIETLNPHIHEEKGDEHIREMILMSLATIYHSSVSTDNIKQRIIKELKNYNALGDGEEPPKPQVMPPIGKIDARKWFDGVRSRSDSLLYLAP